MSFVDRVKGNLAAADWKVFSFMCLNFCSSTGIVLANKYVFQTLGFAFGTTLTWVHSVMTFVCLNVVFLLGGFTPKRLPLFDTTKLAAGSMGFIVLTNLSLQHNSIGFYQMAKVMTTPTVVVIEALLYKKYLENNLKVALIPVCIGVLLTTATDYSLNVIGTVFAVSGIIVTSFYQIWAGSLQKSLNCDALQLQYYTSAIQAVIILPFLPLLDNWRFSSNDSVWNYDFTLYNSLAILGTGCIAFLVNISIFLIIGKSSPVTYNIVGHAKTCFILLMDFVLFGRPVEIKGVSGILCALTGIFWYTHLKLEKNRAEVEAKAAASRDKGEEEMVELVQDGSEQKPDDQRSQ
eukprot:CAMPEP_0198336284 /NCGR_PEP_ID=MMETSP1450-20131203/20892_1 /TAXON_ID=753684 ORGANISM="Madagascaria erythrocladiodes, Strain CCMP3234" /NCGR_SAMPLE_ID=MMETSP1450 /ASSEMBLY_ACC=CAM_ASM_001115 /LENGTH=347 /DNA_ID=CAMNT_0044041007 /DNA_START=69 /DNA_END=1112 /DNA_ORIENTATION=-